MPQEASGCLYPHGVPWEVMRAGQAATQKLDELMEAVRRFSRARP